MSITLAGRTDFGNFDDDLFDFINGGEGFSDIVYSDTIFGVPTIGYGYALILDGSKGWIVSPYLTKDFNGIHTFSAAEITLLQNIATDINAKKVTAAKALFNDRASNLLNFTVNASQAQSLFLDALGRNVAISVASDIRAGLAGTYELIALEDLAYNAPARTAALAPFLREDNPETARLDTWYAILTLTNPNHSPGVENRRIMDAQEFGLYSQGEGSDSAPATSDEGAEAIAAHRFLDARKAALTSAFASDGFGAGAIAYEFSKFYAPANSELISEFGDGMTGFAGVVVAPNDGVDGINLSNSVAKGTILVVAGLGRDTIIDDTTYKDNNLIDVRASGSTLVGGNAAALNDIALFGGNLLNGEVQLNANGAGTDSFGRKYVFDQAAKTLRIVDGNDQFLTISNFAEGDFGITFKKDFSTLITFSEYALGTSIKNQYAKEGIIFGGDSPFITTDYSNPTSPVLSGTPLFNGAIAGVFVSEVTGLRSGVSEFSLDAGYFDSLHSTQLIWYDESGHVLGYETNSLIGIQHFDVTSTTLIGSFRIAEVGAEPNGYAIDNVAFNAPKA